MLLRINGECRRSVLRKRGRFSSTGLIYYRGAKIQNEVITSHKKNVEIEWIWNDLEEKEDCEELSKVITATPLRHLLGH